MTEENPSKIVRYLLGTDKTPLQFGPDHRVQLTERIIPECQMPVLWISIIHFNECVHGIKAVEKKKRDLEAGFELPAPPEEFSLTKERHTDIECSDKIIQYLNDEFFVKEEVPNCNSFVIENTVMRKRPKKK